MVVFRARSALGLIAMRDEPRDDAIAERCASFRRSE